MTQPIGKQRLKLYNRHDCRCYWCRKLTTLVGKLSAHDFATVDHVYPKTDHRRTNVNGQRLEHVLACRACNQKRGDMPHDVFLMIMRPEWRGILEMAA